MEKFQNCTFRIARCTMNQTIPWLLDLSISCQSKTFDILYFIMLFFMGVIEYEVLNYRITCDFFENYRNTVINFLYKYRHRSIFYHKLYFPVTVGWLIYRIPSIFHSNYRITAQKNWQIPNTVISYAPHPHINIVLIWSSTLSGETLSGETIRRAKFSSLKEKFVTFARRKVSPNKSKIVLKWSASEPTSDLSHLDKLWLYWWAKLCRAKFSSGEIFVTFQKIRHFRPTKFRPIR